MSGLELAGVSKSYGAFRAIRDVSLDVAPGEFVVMVGPSGCGKSTLLRTIAGLEAADAGTIRVGGRDVTEAEPSRRGVAMVFQNYALYPHMSVAGNMGFGLKMAGTPRERIRAAVDRAADILRIRDHLPKPPKSLSGGQKQRVAIGRAITRQPEVFLFDEPLSNLDAELRARMRVELGRLHHELAATMVYVTHDQVEAMTMADRIVVLRDGVVEQVGAPLELYNRPANRFVAGFLGAPRMNLLPGRVLGVRGALVAVEAPLVGRVELDATDDGRPLAAGDAVTLGLRPESFRGGPLAVRLELTVVESLGRETLAYGRPAGARDGGEDADVVVQLTQQLRLRPGEAFEARLDPADLFLFDAEGLTRRFARAA
jgi:multiple sugar transport system ATP-binding protein